MICSLIQAHGNSARPEVIVIGQNRILPGTYELDIDIMTVLAFRVWSCLWNARHVKESSMKAAVIKEHGPLGCLEISELPDPAVGENEVLLQVHAAALNHLDIWVRKGRGRS